MPKEAVVVGAGVIGLTTAIALLERGWNVRVYASGVGENTTSFGAGAIWLPYRATHKDVLRWAKETLAHYYHVLEVSPDSTFLMVRKSVGIQARLVGCFHRDHTVKEEEYYFWRSCARQFRSARRNEWPRDPDGNEAQCFVKGFVFETILIDPPLYLRNLIQRLWQLGGRIEIGKVEAIGELSRLFPTARVVVNCTGLGARELLRDTSVYPVRGVLLHTPLLPLPNGWGGIIDVEGGNDGVNSYIFQRTNSLVIGGTAFENDFTVAQDKNVDDDIMRRAKQCFLYDVQRELDSVTPVSWTGLRPARNEVRVEADAEYCSEQVLIHNYGHGGSGFTLCWGCALETARIAETYVPRAKL